MEKKWWNHIEWFVDKAIPYLLIVLLGIIVVEFFFQELAQAYHKLIQVADYVILVFFVADLGFKYHRVRVMKIFLRKYWLDIVAVFPFFLVFRVFEEAARLLGEVRELGPQAQKIVHVGLELKEVRLAEEAGKLGREAEEVSKLSRTERFARFLRPVARVPRIVKAITFYEDPKHKKELKKHLKQVEREAKAGERLIGEGVVKGELFVEKEMKKGEKVFKEVEKDIGNEFRRSGRGQNKRKNVQGNVRTVRGRKGVRLKARKRV